MKGKVSVIIPAYNAEEYIGKCLRSVRNQTYHDYEVIVVDDGSTDDTFMVVASMQHAMENLTVLRQDNAGVSSARNLGKKNAKGEYLLFVDADDTLKPDMLEKLVIQLDLTGADVAVCGITQVDELGNTVAVKRSPARKFTNIEALYSFLKGGVFENGVWNKLIRRELVDTIDFEVGRSMNEDIYFIFQMFQRAEKVVLISDCCYQYLVREDSVSHQEFSEKWYDNVYFAKKIYEEASTFDSFLEPLARSYYIRSVYYVLKLACEQKADRDRIHRKKMKEMKKIIRSLAFKDIRGTVKKTTRMNIEMIRFCYPLWRLLKGVS